jgi:MFS superfamily sulfate permease-like transporter
MASIGGILLYVSTAMVKPAEVKEALAMSKFHIGLMIFTAAMVVVTDFLTGVMTAITIYAVGYWIGKRVETRNEKKAAEPAYSPTGD